MHFLSVKFDINVYVIPKFQNEHFSPWSLENASKWSMN